MVCSDNAMPEDKRMSPADPDRQTGNSDNIGQRQVDWQGPRQVIPSAVARGGRNYALASGTGGAAGRADRNSKTAIFSCPTANAESKSSLTENS